MISPGLFISARYDRVLDALHDHYEREALETQLARWLHAQRWFGGQTRQLRGVQLERWVQIGESACLCVALVADVSGGETEHQVLLVAGSAEGEQRAVIDALEYGPVRAELLRMALSGEVREDYRVALRWERIDPNDPGCSGEGRPMGVEQSNSSVAYDDRCVLKVYRRLERGGNPEVELGRYLTEAGFENVPQLLAVGRLEGSDGYHADAMVLQEYVPNSGDGWRWALEKAREAMQAAGTPQDLEEWLEREGETLSGAAALGRATARLHATLASATGEGLEPEPVSGQDMERWASEVHREAQAATEAMGSAGLQEPDLLAIVEQVRRYSPPALPDSGLKMRVHGDYHLGQVLKSDSGFSIMDFEGEPVRTLAERRELQHPLSDVAGMARSWNYAAYTAAPEPERQELAHTWETAVRAGFLDAYWAEAESSAASFLPSGRESGEALLAMFELRKALYEVRYELNNRPDWVGIPAAAVRRLTAS